MTRAFSNRNRDGSMGEDYPESTEIEQLRARNVALLEALERCQAYASRLDFQMNAEERLLRIHQIAKTARTALAATIIRTVE